MVVDPSLKADVMAGAVGKTKEKQEQFLQAFESSACNVSISCKSIGISRNTFYEWKKKYIPFAEAIQEAQESLLDFAETMLYKAIKDGKTPELIFFLKTKGQARGYIEKQQLSVTQERPDLSGMSIEELKSLAYGSDTAGSETDIH